MKPKSSDQRAFPAVSLNSNIEILSERSDVFQTKPSFDTVRVTHTWRRGFFSTDCGALLLARLFRGDGVDGAIRQNSHLTPAQ